MPFDQAGFVDDFVDDGVLATLRNARHRIRLPSLWCKGQMESAHGRRRCIVGAIDTAAINFAANLKAQERLAQYLPLKFADLPTFNDCSRHRDVVAMFDRAIADLEGRQNAI